MLSAYAPSGHHVLMDLSGIRAELLQQSEQLEQIMVESAKKSGATVLHSHFHSFGEQCGVSGVVLLAESHLSIHTWPENNFAAVDIFMCGESDSQYCMRLIEQALASESCNSKVIQRGLDVK